VAKIGIAKSRDEKLSYLDAVEEPKTRMRIHTPIQQYPIIYFTIPAKKI
jgi:hypothetical protein